MSHRVVRKIRHANFASTLLAACQIAVTLAFVSVARADVVYPAGPTVMKDGTTILLENYANAPFSFRTLTVFPPVANYNDQRTPSRVQQPLRLARPRCDEQTLIRHRLRSLSSKRRHRS